MAIIVLKVPVIISFFEHHVTGTNDRKSNRIRMLKAGGICAIGGNYLVQREKLLLAEEVSSSSAVLTGNKSYTIPFKMISPIII